MKSKHLLVRSVLLYGIVLVFCAGVFIASGSQARASQVISLGDSGLWGNGWPVIVGRHLGLYEQQLLQAGWQPMRIYGWTSRSCQQQPLARRLARHDG